MNLQMSLQKQASFTPGLAVVDNLHHRFFTSRTHEEARNNFLEDVLRW